MSETATFDIVIIGGGPVGLFGSFYAGLRGMRTLIVDSLPELGGQLSAIYPEKYVFDMPGFSRVLASDLAGSLVEQGTRFGPEVSLGETVLSLAAEPDGAIAIETSQGIRRARAVVACAGAGALTPKRLDVPGLQELEGRGVHYFVRSKGQFAGKRVLIVGGGDSAVDWALSLEPIAAAVTLIHRRDVFRAAEASIDRLLHRSRVTTRLFWELRGAAGVERLEQVVIASTRTGEELTLAMDACLVNIGFAASIGPIANWGLELRGTRILVNSHMETSMPGVYAAGDICTYDGKLKLIATGVGEVCTAVNHAKTYIDPSARLFPGHTSNMDL